MGDSLILVLVMMTHRGEFHAQDSHPYIDALPRDHPNRTAIISKYLDRARKECQKECDDQYWEYKAATGLFLKDLPLEDTFATAHLHGVIAGRHNLWQRLPPDGWQHGWLDVWQEEQANARATAPEPIPAPKQN